jgi:hypothetical protein
MRTSGSGNLFRALGKGGTPITNGILIINAATFLLAFASPTVMSAFAAFVAYLAPAVMPHPWVLLTYPLVYLDLSSNGVFNFVLAGFLFYSAGGSLERGWGDSRYGWFIVGSTLVSSLSLTLGCVVLHQAFPLFGFYILAACTAVAFAALLPDDVVGFFFFPLKRKYFALIVIIFAWVTFGEGGRPLLGLFGCGGVLAAYAYTRYGRTWETRGYTGGRVPGTRVLKLDLDDRKRPQRYPDGSFRRAPYDLVGKWRDAQERKKLDRLLKNSGFSDPKWHEDDPRQ